ncbi:undecaprenyl-diphosphatase [Sphingomonas insulae]|uniref:Phosphatidic acid phosphatase type 2/haloperoxidase domain-containing protein n=1 Tax=Sphingomonas insulae TaxID=424800 RepID=A0ABN1HVD4_9SPHN|nr:phosphatase PAP2 family protein [Sphingomonas insulae]NIJ28445.1 undecaprenyl-diphosphatase [Sphingomonas insulae]
MSKAKKAAKTVAAADRKATHDAARHRDATPVKAAGLLAEIADQPQLIAISAATIAAGLIGRRRDLVRGGARMLAAHLLATAAKSAIKHRFDRSRPGKALSDGHTRFERGDSDDHQLNSFPSGHTAGVVAVARAAAREIDSAAVPAALGAGAIAAIQPVAGNHYLSDVIVGGAIGWIAEAIVDAMLEHVPHLMEK